MAHEDLFEPFGEVIAKHLASELHVRMADSMRKWAYHPQSNSVGRDVVTHALRLILETSGETSQALKSGRLAVGLNQSVRGRRRKKKIDLVAGLPGGPTDREGLQSGELLSGEIATPLILLEAKACMTAHQKAGTRLMGELLSTLETAEDLDPKPLLIAFIVLNYSLEFTSPKNLPGPNRHSPDDATKALASLANAIPIGRKVGYDAIVLVPISFDNELTANLAPTHGREPFTERTIDVISMIDGYVAGATT